MFGIQSQRERFRGAFQSDAAALGVAIQSAEEIETGQMDLADGAKQLLRQAITGSAPTKTTSIDTYWLEGPIGRFMFAQPYQAGNSLVGEYHLRMSGALPQPIAFCRASFFRKKWTTAEDRALLGVLESSAELRAATKRLCWSKHTSRGEIVLDWKVQLAALGDGTSQLVVQAGCSALSIDDTELDTFIAVALALAPLFRGEAVAPQGRYFEPRFDDLFFAA